MCSSLKAAAFIKAKEVSKITHCLQNAISISNLWRRGLADMPDPSSSHDWLIIVSPKAVQKFLGWYLSSEMFALQAGECQSFPGGAGSGAGDVCRRFAVHIWSSRTLHGAQMWLELTAAPAELVQCEVLCLCQGKLPQDNSFTKTKQRQLFGSSRMCSLFFSFVLKKKL